MPLVRIPSLILIYQLCLLACVANLSEGATQVAPVPATEAPHRVYIANDDHTDYMWSADADTYDRVFVDLLDFHLKLADETAGNPSPFRARFNTDGNFWLWNYEKQKTAAEFAHLMDRVKDGTIGSPLNTLVCCYGGQPLEAVLRGLYYAGRLERRFDLRFKLANATENQTLPLGLASLFAGAGADYSWRGICNCATRLDKVSLGERDHEIFWYTGHDGQRLLMKWYSAGPHNIGTYLEATNPAASIKYLESDPGFLRRHVDPINHQPYPILGIFGFGGDDLARKTGVTPLPPIPAVPGLQYVPSSPFTEHFHLIAQQQTTAQRQVIVSNEQDFFDDFAQHHGSALPSDVVTYGNEWDLYSASMAETSARVKRAVEKLRSAELLAVLVNLKYPPFMGNHVGARDQAFTDLGLFWEHDWTADGPVTRGQRAAWQDKLAASIEYYVNSLHSEGIVRLGGLIPRPEKASRFFVLNPLGWARTDFADYAYRGSADIHVHDLHAGRDVPHQLIEVNGAHFLRVLAPEVPSAGYKVFEIRAGPGGASREDAAGTNIALDGIIENEAVKIAIARDGSIRSFIDKTRPSLEFVKAIDGLHLNDLSPNSDDGEPITVENRGPVSVTLRARSGAGLSHTTSITLYRHSDRVDIRNEITANFSDVRHWAFSFDLPSPSVRSEEVGAINLNKLRSEGGDYALRNARYDYITLNHFADISAGDDSRGVTISNADLAFAKLGHSTVQQLDALTPQINVLAGGQIDGPSLGIHDQNGATYFLQRFALRAHGAYDAATAMRVALEHQNPLTTGSVIGKPGAPYPESTYSLVSLSNPRVLLWALKPADDGIDHGIVARLWNVADVSEATSVSLVGGVNAVRRTTHIETDLDALPVSPDGSFAPSFARQQLSTFRLITKSAAPPAQSQ
ncbi:MAG: glycoside hydrolase [Opitutus sp.]